MTDLTLVVVAKDDASLDAFPRAYLGDVEFIGIVNYGGLSLARIGNYFLQSTAARTVVGLCHADCTFGEGALEAFTQAALDGAVCGIVGIDLSRVYRWCHTKAPIMHPDGVAENGPGEVSTLDGCAVFLSFYHHLQFDEATFDGFHCHIPDICLQAHARNIPVIVPAAEAWHTGESTPEMAWQADFQRYKKRLTEKWAGVRFETT